MKGGSQLAATFLACYRMEKKELEIVGLSYSQTQSGAYALVLGEKNGKRRLPIIIGGFEAQAIAIELEKMKPSRPLTHDLFKSLADLFDIKLNEVIIYNLVEGIFFAKIICSQGEKTVEIDTRTSDAIALAVRFNCPVYTYEFILSSAGIILEEGKMPDKEADELEAEETTEPESAPKKEKTIREYSEEELNNLLQKAIEEENYELASTIKKELDRRKNESN